MTDTLCFQARAIYDAFNRIGLSNEPSFETDRKALSAALRAAADCLDHAQSAHTLHAFADDLEGIKYGTYRCDLPKDNPKPSLKEQALKALNEAVYMADDSPPEGISTNQADVIRLALETLPND